MQFLPAASELQAAAWFVRVHLIETARRSQSTLHFVCVQPATDGEAGNAEEDEGSVQKAQAPREGDEAERACCPEEGNQL
jgi:hypothetical protein